MCLLRVTNLRVEAHPIIPQLGVVLSVDHLESTSSYGNLRLLKLDDIVSMTT